VHTTQFAIRDPAIGLYRPVLELAADTVRTWSTPGLRPRRRKRDAPNEVLLIAGIVGDTKRAVAEASTAASLGYHAGLLSLAGLDGLTDADLVRHCRAVADVIPVFGFYLQPAVGGRVLSYRFWRELAEIQGLVAVKIAPFDRYRTIDVVRAMVTAGRDDVALYTGNDDNILVDLLTPFTCVVGEQRIERRIVGGLLGQWAVWTRRAVEMLARIKSSGATRSLSTNWLGRAAALTDANGAVFDAANRFAGCIPGIHEVLRRQGLLRGTWCLDPHEKLSPGQSKEIDRVSQSYPDLVDDEWVAERRDRWLA
jgi:dihydrodipicolinate synthase/N-acetylneuraminate lyase